MKRDWDLIRKLLTDIEEERDVLADIPAEPKWVDIPWEKLEQTRDEYMTKRNRILGHLELLIDNGYIDGIYVERGADGDFSVGLSGPRLTMAGHDLLDTMRSSTIWESIKATAKKKGIELTFDAIKVLAATALTRVIG